MGCFFPGKPAELYTIKPLQNFAVMNLLSIVNRDSIRRCVGRIQGKWEKNGRTKTETRGKFVAPPESR